jgi:hypothetical protein
VTTRQIITPANTRAQAAILLSHQLSRENVGYTAIQTTPLPNTKRIGLEFERAARAKKEAQVKAKGGGSPLAA